MFMVTYKRDDLKGQTFTLGTYATRELAEDAVKALYNIIDPDHAMDAKIVERGGLR